MAVLGKAMGLCGVLLSAAAGAACAAGSASPEQPRLVLEDFEKPTLVNRLGGQGQAWGKYGGSAHVEIVPQALPGLFSRPRNNVLHLSYELPEGTRARAGFRMSLQGLDARQYDHVELWIRGDPARGFARAVRIGFLRPDEKAPGMQERGSFVVSGIDKDWQHVRVPLNKMNGIARWDQLDAFVIEEQARRAGKPKGAFFADDIALVRTGEPGPSAQDPVPQPRKAALKRSLGPERLRARIQARFDLRPGSGPDPAVLLRLDDRGLLRRLAQDTWKGLLAMTDRESRLPADNVRLLPENGGRDAVRIGDYTNITNVGLYLISVVGAWELGLISRTEAVDRLVELLDTLGRLETYNGFFYNYYDTTTLERSSNFLSFVDSAWLTAGLMVVRSALPELADAASRFIEQTDYGWFYDDVEQLMNHGYYVNLQYPSEYQYGLLYTETRTGSLIAIGKGDVPAEHWFRMYRTFPAEDRWQSQTPHGVKTRHVAGYTFQSGYYQWRGLRYVPSWGGSMFEALMPTLVLDEQRYAPHSLGINDRRHVEIQRIYATEVLGYPVWGMSPSAAVGDGDGYHEYGVKPLGVRGYGAGVVTPHATLLALAVDPEAAVANLRRLIQRYPVYGPYGLYDAVDPRSGRVNAKYLLLDQAMSFIALVNHLRDHAIQKHFAADPIAAAALPLIGEERFFD